MKCEYTLDKNDLITILADYFEVSKDNVSVKTSKVLRGCYMDEDYYYEPEATVRIGLYDTTNLRKK